MFKNDSTSMQMESFPGRQRKKCKYHSNGKCHSIHTSPIVAFYPRTTVLVPFLSLLLHIGIGWFVQMECNCNWFPFSYFPTPPKRFGSIEKCIAMLVALASYTIRNMAPDKWGFVETRNSTKADCCASRRWKRSFRQTFQSIKTIILCSTGHRVCSACGFSFHYAASQSLLKLNFFFFWLLPQLFHSNCPFSCTLFQLTLPSGLLAFIIFAFNASLCWPPFPLLHHWWDVSFCLLRGISCKYFHVPTTSPTGDVTRSIINGFFFYLTLTSNIGGYRG